MGNSDNTPNDGKLSLDTSAPLWSAILTEVTKGTKIAQFKPPTDALKTATVDAFTGLKPGPFTTQDGQGILPARDRPEPRRRCSGARPRSTPRPACCGRTAARARRSRAASSTCPRSRPTSRTGRRRTLAWGARAARGSGVRGGPKGTRTAYFYNGAFAPFGRTWGAPFQPRDEVPALHAAGLLRSVRHRPTRPPRRRPASRSRPTRVAGPGARRRRPPTADADGTDVRGRRSHGRSELDDRRPVAAFAALAGPHRLHQRVAAAIARTASRSAPVPMPWMIRTLSSPARPASSR